MASPGQLVLENLVVRLRGNSAQYEEMLKRAEAKIVGTVKVIEQQTRQAQAQMNKALEEGARITQAVATPVERYGTQLGRLRELLRSGAISQQAFQRSAEQLRQSLPTVSKAQEEVNRQIQRAKQITEAVSTPMEQYKRLVNSLRGLLVTGRITQETYNRAIRQARIELPGVKAAQEQLNREMQQAKAITESLITPTERYRDTIATLSRFLKSGRISQETYNRAIKQAKADLPAARAAQEQYNRAVQRGKQIAEEIRRPLEIQRQKIAELNRLYAQGAISAQTYARAVRGAGNSLTLMGTQLRGIGLRLRGVSRTMSLFVSGPLIGIGIGAVRSFASFDRAMINSQSIMGDLSDDVKMRMNEVARSISEVSITAPTQLAESFFFLASAGFDAEESIKALAKVEQFAVAGLFDMATATDLLTDAQTALGLEGRNTEERIANLVTISNALVQANTQANASVLQFAKALTTDAATAAQGFGADMFTVLAVLDAYAQKGKKGAEAGNLFGRATRLLARAFEDNADTFQRLGIDVIDKTSGGYRNLIDIIGDMEKAFEGLEKPQINMQLGLLGFEALARKSILPLIGMSKAMKVWEKELRAGGVTAEEVANKQLKSFSAQIAIVRNNLSLMLSDIGSILAPVIGGIGKRLTALSKFFRSLSTETKQWIVFIGAAIAAAGPLGLILGTLAIGAGLFISAIGALAPLVVPIIAIGAAIAAVTAAVAIGIEETIGLANAWTSFKESASTAINNVIGFFTNLRTNIDILLNFFRDNWKTILLDITSALATFNTNMEFNLGVAFGAILIIGIRAFTGILRLAREGFNLLADEIPGLIGKGLGKASKVAAKFALAPLSFIFQGGEQGLDEAFNTLERIAENESKALAQVVNDEIANAFSKFKSPLEGLELLTEAPKLALEGGKEVGEKIAQGIAEGVKAASGPVTEAIEDTFKEGFREQFAGALLDDVVKAMAAVNSEIQKLEFARIAEETGQSIESLAFAARGASPELLAELRILEATKKALEDESKQLEKAASLTEKFRDPVQKLIEDQQELHDLFKSEKITLGIFEKAMEDLQKTADKGVKVKFSTSGIEAFGVDSIEFLSQLDRIRTQATPDVTVPIPSIAPPTVTTPAELGLFSQVPIRELIGDRDPFGSIETKEEIREMERKEELEVLKKIAENTTEDAFKDRIVVAEANI